LIYFLVVGLHFFTSTGPFFRLDPQRIQSSKTTANRRSGEFRALREIDTRGELRELTTDAGTTRSSDRGQRRS
jgi:hypothetical protein